MRILDMNMDTFMLQDIDFLSPTMLIITPTCLFCSSIKLESTVRQDYHFCLQYILVY